MLVRFFAYGEKSNLHGSIYPLRKTAREKYIYITGIVLPLFTFQAIWLGLPQYTMKYLLLGNLDLWQGKEVTRFKKILFICHSLYLNNEMFSIVIDTGYEFSNHCRKIT